MDINIKFEAIQTMPKLKQEIINHLFEYISRKKYEEWYRYKGEFKYEGKEYNLECECKMNNKMFTYRNMFIEHKQQIIDVDEMVKQGLLN